jgi:hypothetical protein
MSKVDMSAWYEGLFKILWYTQLPCFDVKGVTSRFAGQRSLLKQCKWKGATIPCSAIFTTFPTDRGMCCAFNMKKANEIFEAGMYTDMVTNMQEFDRNNSFGNNIPPKWYTIINAYHIMLRDLLTQKSMDYKTVTGFRYPEHVDSENIKFKIGRRSYLYQLFSKRDFYFINCG